MNRKEMFKKVFDYCYGMGTDECDRKCVIYKEMGCFVICKGTDYQLTKACELIDELQGDTRQCKVFTPGTEEMILNNFLKGSRR